MSFPQKSIFGYRLMFKYDLKDLFHSYTPLLWSLSGGVLGLDVDLIVSVPEFSYLLTYICCGEYLYLVHDMSWRVSPCRLPQPLHR